MLSRVGRLLRDPRRHVPRLLKMTQQPLCYLLRRAPFFLQGQMDIHPRSRWHNPEFVELTGGFFPSADSAAREISDLEPWDTTRRDMLILLLRTIVEQRVEGAFAEVGVYRGYTARLIHHYVPEKALHLFDTFEGFTERSVAEEQERTGLRVSATHFGDADLRRVREYVSPRNENVFFHKGYFPDSVPKGFEDLRFAFVHLDADLYDPTSKGLAFFYPRMNQGGMILVHDYNAWPGARAAVDGFFAEKEETPIPMPDKSGSALVVRRRQRG